MNDTREGYKDTWEDGVPKIDTEEGQLEVVLDTAKNNAHVRRPDGRKPPLLLVAEEVFRLRQKALRSENDISYLSKQLTAYADKVSLLSWKNKELSDELARLKQTRKEKFLAWYVRTFA